MAPKSRKNKFKNTWVWGAKRANQKNARHHLSKKDCQNPKLLKFKAICLFIYLFI